MNEKRANTQSSIPTNTPPMSHDCSDQSYSYTQAWAYWAGGGRQPPQFVGQTKSVGQYSLNSRAILAYYKKNGTNSVNFVGNFVISEKLVCFEKFWYVRKFFGPLKWYTDRNFFGDRGGGGEVVKINYGKFVSAPLIFSFRYAHAHKCDHYTSLK